MTQFTVYAAVTVSAFTIVEADTAEQALEIANTRDAVMYFNGSGTYPEDSFVVEDIDGQPFDMRVE